MSVLLTGDTKETDDGLRRKKLSTDKTIRTQIRNKERAINHMRSRTNGMDNGVRPDMRLLKEIYYSSKPTTEEPHSRKFLCNTSRLILDER